MGWYGVRGPGIGVRDPGTGVRDPGTGGSKGVEEARRRGDRQ
jgi:hypothetical protein